MHKVSTLIEAYDVIINNLVRMNFDDNICKAGHVLYDVNITYNTNNMNKTNLSIESFEIIINKNAFKKTYKSLMYSFYRYVRTITNHTSVLNNIYIKINQ